MVLVVLPLTTILNSLRIGVPAPGDLVPVGPKSQLRSTSSAELVYLEGYEGEVFPVEVVEVLLDWFTPPREH
ncbi:hypothetical protein CAEBREN_02954 [Caenorhabditis brenneri]|uniref:Uncharacterized protein n=1 Tax=Caenorhabditis brenneri TaxID=135651 RepID=G0N2X6_CAEBE|nr:hypothetical protein CAEBREN_02954 [Caenorhabditis brenneri]